VPKEGKITAFASQPNAFLKGQSEFALRDDYNPIITVQLEKDASAMIRGMVVDSWNNGVSGVLVSVVGHGSEGITTGADGSFELAAHAAIGEEVRLHVEKDGFLPKDQYHPAGDEAVTVVIQRQ
jgi:hypothetical protein